MSAESIPEEITEAELYGADRLTAEEIEASVRFAFEVGRFITDPAVLFAAQLRELESRIDDAKAAGDLAALRALEHEAHLLHQTQLGVESVYRNSHDKA